MDTIQGFKFNKNTVKLVFRFQTFLDSPIPGTDQPACRDYLLRENELLHAFLSLKIVLYTETEEKKNDETAYLASLIGIKIG